VVLLLWGMDAYSLGRSELDSASFICRSVDISDREQELKELESEIVSCSKVVANDHSFCTTV